MTNELDFSGLPEEAVKRLSGYLGKMIEIIGVELKSIVVYGSAVAGEFDSKRSNINLVITVDKLKLDLL
ncbi:hypothetical protein GF359_00525, partial [candidate division WOR-3 bacterium]|nr:hypothetical protein [candidate division WOR-3 bacterium]MBD3363677.1 hypothetical protein [candidate division WOR-3 bacterium]